MPAAGSSTSRQAYRFVHTTPSNGANYYRLLQRDNDGRYTFSDVKRVQFTGNTNRLIVLGNPVVHYTSLHDTIKPLIIRKAAVSNYGLALVRAALGMTGRL